MHKKWTKTLDLDAYINHKGGNFITYRGGGYDKKCGTLWI